MSFCSEMELAYSAADMVVARSGASTLTEIAAFGLPAILVPYPHAASNHQWHNARVFERAGAARLIDQSQFDGRYAERGERLADVVTELLDNETSRASMARAAHSLAVDDAADRITTLLERYGKQATTN
jgi:UDP-N-acetylglucosamine--N-acetylmuramyl-(pentapeptide) pyrophosphoryl-undecaprenol N-acetylglucosamine transferase